MSDEPDSAHDYAKKTLDLVLHELNTAGDEARLQIHLFTLEAKRHWNEVEARVKQIESRLGLGEGQPTGDSRELARAIRELLAEQRADVSPQEPVSAVMHTSARTCRADESLKRAVEILKETQASALAVVDEEGRLLGMLNERSICLALYASGATLADTPVATALSDVVCAALVTEPLARAAEIMRQHKVSQMPVTETDGRVVGMLSLSDLARRSEVDSEHPPDPAWLAATLVDIYAA